MTDFDPSVQTLDRFTPLATPRQDRLNMVKYLGSKRLLIPLILRVVASVAGGRPHSVRQAGVVLDLFSGTSRVGHALKRLGWRVLANDHNAYAHTLGTCYVQADRETVLHDANRLIEELNALARRGRHDAGWFTDTYCLRARYFHPSNGERIEALRSAIADWAPAPELEAVLLTSLMEAADRVDSTVGVQMAYLKNWAPRARNHLELRVPDVVSRPPAGKCLAFGMEALDAVQRLEADVAYLDPPYNQHSYLGNYHVWETLVRWDRPAVYGVACKRSECRERRSVFNSRTACRAALERVIQGVRARTVIVSFNDEGHIAREEMTSMLAPRGPVVVIERDAPRYVGARIGIYNPRGEKVGRVGRLRNTEYIFVAGETAEQAARDLEAGDAVRAR